LKAIKGVACDEKEEGTLSAYIKLWVSEVGIFVHSIIIGITLGITKTQSFARTLLIVLVVHQLFEGLTVGTLVIAAHCNKLQSIFFVLLFAIGVPVGVGIGMGVQDHVDKVATGVLLSMSGGILIFVACVEMLPHIFGSHHHHAHGPIPVAEIHDHLHGQSQHHDHGHSHHHGHSHGHHDHDHDHHEEEGEMKNNKSEPTEQQQKVVINSSGTPENNASASAEIDDGKKEVEEKKKEDDSSSTPTSTSRADYHDRHEDDEEVWFRFLCYFGIIIGCSIQSVLGIWA
jgi:hypothetical protein